MSTKVAIGPWAKYHIWPDYEHIHWVLEPSRSDLSWVDGIHFVNLSDAIRFVFNMGPEASTARLRSMVTDSMILAALHRKDQQVPESLRSSYGDWDTSCPLEFYNKHIFPVLCPGAATADMETQS